MQIIIEVVSGPSAGKKISFHVGQTVHVGRAESAHLAIPEDGRLSNVHYSVECERSQCRVRDLAGKGTFINGKKIAEAILRDGDKISAGSSEFTVHMESEPATVPAPAPASPVAAPQPVTAPVAAAAPSKSATSTSRGPRSFYVGLYQEHLEEASFLYEQRLSLFSNPEITWKKIGEFEERFEAHIDALVVGEDVALEVCKNRAAEGDSGELHAAVRVFCRQNRLDLLLQVIEGLDPEDPEKLRALADALKHELPADWESHFAQMLSAGKPTLIRVVAELAGYRRFSVGTQLLQALPKATAATLPTLIWALGRLRDQGTRTPLLTHYLKHEVEPVGAATALALLRLGEQQAIEHCSRCVLSQTWPFLALGLGGSRSTVRLLLEIATSGLLAPNCLIALGLLGDVSAVPPLVAILANPDVADSAALALDLITGARLCEEAFIPEEIDPDELFEEEREKLKKGEPPMGPGGRPLGSKITRLSQKPQDWQNWWSEQRSRFNTGLRYRGGKPYSLAGLLENLESPQTPHKVRQWISEELVIRYGADFPFEADLFVTQQQLVLAKMGQWVQTQGSRFQDGVWYFSGQLLSP